MTEPVAPDDTPLILCENCGHSIRAHVDSYGVCNAATGQNENCACLHVRMPKPVAPDDTPTRLPMSLQDRVELYLKVTERAKSGLVREIWAEVSRLRSSEAVVADVIDRLEKHTRALHFQRTTPDNVADLVDAICEHDSKQTAEVSRLREALNEKEELLKQIMRAVHVGTFQAAPVAVEGLSESVSRLQQENARLQAENGLMKRSLGILERTISEAEGR